MKEEYLIIDTNILIRKANKTWQKILAWIVSIPVKIFLVIAIVYFAIAMIFGLMAIVYFIGSLFTGETDRALLVLVFYIPFLIFFLFTLISPGWYENKIVLAIIFILSNLVFWIVPILYGAYYLRYNYLEGKLQKAEYDRCYDNYCKERISAYKNRRALFAVTTDNHIVVNEHVGHSWSCSNNINGVPVKNEPIYIWISEEDTIKIVTYAYESDVYMDVGINTTRFKVPWNTLVDHRVNLSHYVPVMENRGRFTGGMCVMESKYSLKKVSENNININKERKDYRIPNDSIMKYFFIFQKIYNKQYERNEKPWERYMTEEDRNDHERSLQELGKRRFEDDGSRYRIDD